MSTMKLPANYASISEEEMVYRTVQRWRAQGR